MPLSIPPPVLYVQNKIVNLIKPNKQVTCLEGHIDNKYTNCLNLVSCLMQNKLKKMGKLGLYTKLVVNVPDFANLIHSLKEIYLLCPAFISQ